MLSRKRSKERGAARADWLAIMGRFLADASAGPRIDVHAAFRGSKVCNKVHGATGTPRPERVCPFLAAASAAGVKVPTTHVEASARALEQLRQTQTVNSEHCDQLLRCFLPALALLNDFPDLKSPLYALRRAIQACWQKLLVPRIGCRGRLAQRYPVHLLLRYSGGIADERIMFFVNRQKSSGSQAKASVLTEYRYAHPRICHGAEEQHYRDWALCAPHTCGYSREALHSAGKTLGVGAAG